MSKVNVNHLKVGSAGGVLETEVEYAVKAKTAQHANNADNATISSKTSGAPVSATSVANTTTGDVVTIQCGNASMNGANITNFTLTNSKHSASTAALDSAPVFAGTNTITLTAGGKQSSAFTVPFATEATNLTNTPSLSKGTTTTTTDSGSTKTTTRISTKVTAGEKTSTDVSGSYFYVPYAESAPIKATITTTDATNGDTITLTSGSNSDSFTLTNAKCAYTATNLANIPSLLTSSNTIAVKAGEKTSNYITVPYATSAGSATYDTNGRNLTSIISAKKRYKITVRIRNSSEGNAISFSYLSSSIPDATLMGLINNMFNSVGNYNSIPCTGIIMHGDTVFNPTMHISYYAHVEYDQLYISTLSRDVRMTSIENIVIHAQDIGV